MVSGFVTSPCDQLRIFSGDARLMRIASKSAIGFARSKGLERNKVSSTSHGISLPPAAPKGSGQLSDQVPVTWLRAQELNGYQLFPSKLKTAQWSHQFSLTTGHWSSIRFQQHAARLLRGCESVSARSRAEHRLLLASLDQLDIQTQ